MSIPSAVDPEVHDRTSSHQFPVLVLGALGVVYGDIGTSPLYAFREALHATHGAAGPATAEVLGLLSLIIWALTIIVTIKYVGFVLKADNKGEGGTLSLMALARDSLPGKPAWVLVLGIMGDRCSSAMRSLPPPFPCSRRSKAWRWSRRA